MPITINGSTGITSDGGYTGDGLTIQDGASSSTVNIGVNGGIGIGFTPSLISGTYYNGLELGKVGSGIFAANNFLTASELTWLTNNTYPTYSAGTVWKYANTGAAVSYGLEDGNHLWYTAPSGTTGATATFTPRMVLENTGRLGVGTISPDINVLMHVAGRIRSDSAAMVLCSPGDLSTTGVAFLSLQSSTGIERGWVGFGDGTGVFGISNSNTSSIVFNTGGTRRANLGNNGDFTVSGNVTAYGSPSDRRLKENIEPLIGALASVEAINGYRYNYIGKTDKLLGVIAQEVEAVAPELIYEFTDLEDKQWKAVRYEHMTALLIEAVKELSARVKQLEAR